jgi:hypothetical protein
LFFFFFVFWFKKKKTFFVELFFFFFARAGATTTTKKKKKPTKTKGAPMLARVAPQLLSVLHRYHRLKNVGGVLPGFDAEVLEQYGDWELLLLILQNMVLVLGLDHPCVQKLQSACFPE